MCSRRVTVFGGTGFLGRHIVRHLLDADLAVRIASRHPDRAKSLFPGDVSGVESAHADVNDDGSVARAVAGAWAVVNTVSLYAERGKCTFRSVHVDAAKRIAMLARQAGAEILVHISGIGADAGSASPYIRSRGEGEAAVPIMRGRAGFHIDHTRLGRPEIGSPCYATAACERRSAHFARALGTQT